MDNEDKRECMGRWEDTHTIDNVPVYNFSNTGYHYTTLDTFWKIIKLDTFWATHVRFSNDEEEYFRGKSIIEKIIGDAEDRFNHYLICFSDDGNILSQWREYGQRGVSIKMDFSNMPIYTILQNEFGTEARIVSSRPIQVLYTNVADNIKNTVFNQGNLPEFKFSKLKSAYRAQIKDNNEFKVKRKYVNIVPYIKHIAFEEEKESRLIFSMLKSEEYQYINYIKTDDFKKPYLKVKFGDVLDSIQECRYIQFGKRVRPDVQTGVISLVSSLYPSIVNGNQNVAPPDDDHIYISAGKNQEEVFRAIDKLLNEASNEHKIWCDGHWPIREIWVGPTANKKQIVESIRHYCDNHYWLKHVHVDFSLTPYREKKMKQIAEKAE